MNKEIWNDAVGYEGRYQVSNFGHVRSVSRWVNAPQGRKLFLEGKVLQLQPDNVGYMHVSLLDENHKIKRWTVHRLVAIAFIENPHNYPIVNHKDENKSNNNVSNLEWCTQSYNLSYNNGQKKRRERKVEMLDKDTGITLRTFNSLNEASIIMKINRTTISGVLGNKHRHTAGGYKWRYADKTN